MQHVQTVEGRTRGSQCSVLSAVWGLIDQGLLDEVEHITEVRQTTLYPIEAHLPTAHGGRIC